MEISEKLKERFCKDCNIPIKIFKEPYFMERLELFDKYFGTLEKWDIFVKELQEYKCEQDYFEEYNRVKDEAINDIKSTQAYQLLNSEDMNKFQVTHKNLPSKDIFKQMNDGKMFISIDMKKANFSALRHYGQTVGHSMFGTRTWEDYISGFTDNQHIINSKYIRQVILGNCNPKRHITYEKWIMDQILSKIESELGKGFTEHIVFFSNDEIVYDVSNSRRNYTKDFQDVLEKYFDIPFRIETFNLRKIVGTDGYYKKIYKGHMEYDIDFKCLNNYMIPFVLRAFNGEEVKENDKIFIMKDYFLNLLKYLRLR